ncbi:MAG TPA: DUF2254 domain-containing protein [Rudaea sp.]|nr:DUF2254 domain-containing protein [Rudaea sp.]HSC12188.1 DUF2254 domain-containing protein [Rhodanobacteraceae bacterium]
MTWLQRHQLASFFRNSVWLPPVIGMIIALVVRPVVQDIDAMLGWKSPVGPDAARAVLGILVSALLTFIVFVFSILLLIVQIASAQLSPRIIAPIYRSRVVRSSLALFVFTFTYTLAALARIEDSVPQVSMWLAVYSSVLSIAVFLYMIDHVGKALRPVIVLSSVGSSGQKVVEDVYPQLSASAHDKPANAAESIAGKPSSIVTSKRTGVVLALDVDGVAEMARRADCQIEFVPLVGEFVTNGDPLFKVYAGAREISDRELQHAVAIGAERTYEQDPAFAFRIVVDIAAKALSPAINDPTTGVLALDQIHRLLRAVAGRNLDTGRVYDSAGKLRLKYRTPDWEDFVLLAITEIRQFGRESIQIVRRMRALLQNLIETVPPQRAVLLRAELETISRGVEVDFRDAEDRVRAGAGDSLGVGGGR